MPVTSLVHQKHRRADDSAASDCPLLDAPGRRALHTMTDGVVGLEPTIIRSTGGRIGHYATTPFWLRGLDLNKNGRVSSTAIRYTS